MPEPFHEHVLVPGVTVYSSMAWPSKLSPALSWSLSHGLMARRYSPLSSRRFVTRTVEPGGNSHVSVSGSYSSGGRSLNSPTPTSTPSTGRDTSVPSFNSRTKSLIGNPGSSYYLPDRFRLTVSGRDLRQLPSYHGLAIPTLQLLGGDVQRETGSCLE